MHRITQMAQLCALVGSRAFNFLSLCGSWEMFLLGFITQSSTLFRIELVLLMLKCDWVLC